MKKIYLKLINPILFYFLKFFYLQSIFKIDFFIEILGLCFSPLNIYFFLYSHKFYY